MRPTRLLLTLSALVTVIWWPSVAAPAQADAGGPRFYWQWSDGSNETARSFREGRSGDQSRLPRLIVRSEPARSGRSVTLQFRDGSTWRSEDSGRTNAAGAVTLEFNPYCGDGSWCSGSVDYRVLAGTRTTTFTITFAP